MARENRRLVQKRLQFPRRPGRPRKQPEDRRGHHRRPEIDPSRPLLITVRFREGLPSARTADALNEFANEVLRRCSDRFRVIEYSLQRDHYHVLVELDLDRLELGRLLQGFRSSLARAWNELWGRTGGVVAPGYHARPQRNAEQAGNSTAYVVWNGWHHDVAGVGPDGYSSARWSRAWARPLDERDRPPFELPLAAPRTPLLREAFRRFPLEPYRPPTSLVRRPVRGHRRRPRAS